MLKLLGPKQGCPGAPLLPNSPLYSQQIINAQFQTGSLRCVGSGWQRDLPAVILRTWVEIMRRSELLVLGEMWMKSCQHRQICRTNRLHQLSPVPFVLYLKFKSVLGGGTYFLNSRPVLRWSMTKSNYVPTGAMLLLKMWQSQSKKAVAVSSFHSSSPTPCLKEKSF